MRQFILSAASCLALACLGPALAVPRAWAQTAVPPQTPVDQTSAPPAKPAAPAKPQVGTAKPAATPAKPPPPAPPPPVSSVVVPAAPPPPPVLPPPIEVPVRPASPPAPPAIASDAPGSFSKIPSGLRITFGAGRADLNPDTAGALRTLAHTAQPGTDTAFNVAAFAAGTPDDPSTARRLSLARALAARAVLIGEGVASVRIYVKALGVASPAVAGAAPDRADVTIIVRPASSAASAPAAPPPPPKAAP